MTLLFYMTLRSDYRDKHKKTAEWELVDTRLKFAPWGGEGGGGLLEGTISKAAVRHTSEKRWKRGL